MVALGPPQPRPLPAQGPHLRPAQPLLPQEVTPSQVPGIRTCWTSLGPLQPQLLGWRPVHAAATFGSSAYDSFVSSPQAPRPCRGLASALRSPGWSQCRPGAHLPPPQPSLGIKPGQGAASACHFPGEPSQESVGAAHPARDADRWEGGPSSYQGSHPCQQRVPPAVLGTPPVGSEGSSRLGTWHRRGAVGVAGRPRPWKDPTLGKRAWQGAAGVPTRAAVTSAATGTPGLCEDWHPVVRAGGARWTGTGNSDHGARCCPFPRSVISSGCSPGPRPVGADRGHGRALGGDVAGPLGARPLLTASQLL